MTDDPAAALTAYLHTHIPLTAAMGVRVLAAGSDGVRLHAPLGPNLNHRDTAFGGSLSGLGILAGWCVMHVRLRPELPDARLVIAKSEATYARPADDNFTAECRTPDAGWEKLLRAYRRTGRGRITLISTLACRGEPVATVTGQYVALDPARVDDRPREPGAEIPCPPDAALDDPPGVT